MTTNVPLIRLVDDDELFRVSQMMLLKTRGWEVECYESGEAFLEKADLKRPAASFLTYAWRDSPACRCIGNWSSADASLRSFS